MGLRRRQILAWLAAAVPARLAVASAPRTPRATTGPFYPRELPLDSDNDLVHVDGATRAATGDHANLVGRVLDSRGDAIGDARVEIWQCDANARYHHPDDDSPGYPDPAFQGYGQTRTDVSGRYRFLTIRPVPYPGRDAPHIHFRVTAPGRKTLATQLYVKDYPNNARDILYRLLGDNAPLVSADFQPDPDDPDLLLARFDIVLG